MSEQITIQGIDFNVESPFAEGHVLTAGQARALNQVLHENLRNNFAKQVKTAKDAGEPDVAALQTALDAYAQTYEFGVRVAGAVRAPADPVGKEAFTLARDAVKAAIRKKGLNPANYEAAQIAELAKAALEKNHDRFYELARQRIAEREALAGNDLGLDVGEPAPSAEGAVESKPAKARGKKAA